MVSTLSGCWDYRGLNTIDIVSGIAIDKDDEGLFLITFEIIAVNSAKKEGEISSTTMEVKGETVFEAIRNAKRKAINQLYFAHNQVLIISHQIAKEDGINTVLDTFIRVPEYRETSGVVISAEDTASELLKTEHGDAAIISFEIMEIIKKDNELSASTRYIQKYMIYEEILNQGDELTLPVFHLTRNGDEMVNETDGVAAFKGDKLVGYINPEQTKYYLIAIDEAKGGVITLISDETYSFEVMTSKTSLSYELIDGKFKFIVKPLIEVRLVEDSSDVKETSGEEIKVLEEALQKKVIEEMSDVIIKAQNEFESDIFGFGAAIYNKNLKLWNTVKEDWNSNFQEVDFEIKPNVVILDTDLLL